MMLTHSPAGEDAISQLLAAWVESVLRYDAIMAGDAGEGGDCCWWYNERANVSVLAGAAWAKGWVALEEYSRLKRAQVPMSGVDDEDGLDARGRVDLYVSTHDEDYAFEAKQVWLRLDPGFETAGYSGKITEGMNAARQDALKLVGEADAHYAVTFVIPFISAAALDEAAIADLNGRLSQWLSGLSTCPSYAGCAPGHGPVQMAYVFPRMEERCYVNAAGYYYPGVLMLLEDISDCRGPAELQMPEV
ncbi:hypothetical protein QQF45_03570 [Halopseudomonas aestusnigri]|uniref:hypothetical protein n=1 Tax=Halopseudomonas aestusnigri TaxID=857252 RepID=UPI002555EA30|nr:hypothetical protein [Halopseudomonas aestusnigri]MDL2198140.1 hypothetical protein [Halopseudomonas aestusnigri]